jgi:O-antigen ligase
VSPPAAGSGTPPREDPWEARERQREKWRRAAEPSSRRRQNQPEAPRPEISSESGFRGDYLLFGLLIAVGILLIAEVPSIAAVDRELFARIGTGVLLLLIGGAREFMDDLRIAFRRGPNPLILLLLAWTVYEFCRAPFPGFASTELFRILDGIGAYFLCAYCLRAPRQTGIFVAGLLAMGVCLSLSDISSAGQHAGGITAGIGHRYSVFGTHENVGSLLLLMLPLAVAFGVSPAIEEKRRLAAAAAALILAVAELLARTRSAWIGGVVALTVLAALSYRFPDVGAPKRKSRPRAADLLGSPVAFIALAAVVFLLLAGAAPYVLHRATSFHSALSDSSFTGRLEMWSGAVRMAWQKPWRGWGLGAYPVLQGIWTHSGVEPFEAIRVGVAQESIAHNYYAQWAADTGGIGLALYLAVLLSFLWTAVRSVRRVEVPAQRALLLGCIAAVAGGMVDSIASPAYNFHGVWTVYWCAMGLGVAAMRPLRHTVPPSPALESAPARVLTVSVGVAALLSLAVVASGYRVLQAGVTVPRGQLELISLPARPVVPGEPIRWIAIFRAADGADRATMPGTIWLPPPALARAQVKMTETEDSGSARMHAVMLTPAPSVAGQLTMHIRYQDAYGRWYDAWGMAVVQAADRR